MFGDIVKNLRLSYNLSQVQMVKELNVSKQTVSNWENNNILPSIEMLVKISRFFPSALIICWKWNHELTLRFLACLIHN